MENAKCRSEQHTTATEIGSPDLGFDFFIYHF